MKESNIKRLSWFLAIASIISFLIVLFPALRYFLAYVFGIIFPLKGSDLITLGSFLGGSSIALWWHYKNYQQKEIEMRGGLKVKISPLDIISISNTGKLTMKISKIFMVTEKYEFVVDPKALREKYNIIQADISKAIEDNSDRHILPYQTELNLASGEGIDLIKNEENTIREAIAEIPSILRVICIKYETSREDDYTRFIGIYRLSRSIPFESDDKGLQFDQWKVFIKTLDHHYIN